MAVDVYSLRDLAVAEVVRHIWISSTIDSVTPDWNPYLSVLLLVLQVYSESE